MFILRGMMVALGFFGVAYCLLSLLVVCVWQGASLLRQHSAIGRARLLFGLRIFPVLGSAFITLTFALPAFFLLEGGIDEDLGTLLFSVGTLLLLGAGLFRVVTAQAGASRVVAEWLKGARSLDAGQPALRVSQDAPALLSYGVLTPEVLVSETAVALLSPEELRAAVRHEVGHVRSRDNLKKLLLHAAPFPGMASLEQAWQEAAEFAADESAVSNSEDAINLAGALIKLSDLVPLQNPPAFTTGLMHLRALVTTRVERLLAWDEASFRDPQLRWWRFLPLILLTVSYTVAHYGQALLLTHQVTEWFIH
jgi:Zn-dependent protease with chaperone function